jgi:hypothetical protein
MIPTTPKDSSTIFSVLHVTPPKVMSSGFEREWIAWTSSDISATGPIENLPVILATLP